MKVLFVCSGNKLGGPSPIILNQAMSLINKGLDIDYFVIYGKGIIGYLRNVLPLRKYVLKGNYDVVHVHYSSSAFVASIAGATPLVVSLMGSDVQAKWYYKIIIRLYCALFRWKCVIVKSEDMRNSLGIESSIVVPNGVNMDLFRPMNRVDCQRILNWNFEKRHVLFAANPNRSEKNFGLAYNASKYLGDDVVLHSFENVNNSETPIWYNASDVVILSSLWEGSPNVIKEAMACGCPIVSTNVGDIQWLFGDELGHFIADIEPDKFAEKIKQALNFRELHGITKGRDRLDQIGLRSENVAETIVSLYKSVSR